MAGLTGCNPLPNNQQPEPQKITQEQISQTILFANKYSKIYEFAVSSKADIIFKGNKTQIRFTNSDIPKELIEYLGNNRKSIDYIIGMEFIDSDNLSKGAIPVIEISSNVIKDKNGDILDNRTPEQRRKSVL